MTSPGDPQRRRCTAIVEALRKHPRQAMTSTELAVRSGVTEPAELASCLRELGARGLVATHALPADPHLPSIQAVALVQQEPHTAHDPARDPRLDPRHDAAERARQCAAVLERQLLRSHRCQ